MSNHALPSIVRLGIFVLVGCGVICPTVASNAPLRVVDLGYARYQTDVSLEDGVTSFLGIRYGASVADEMRWTPPRKPNNVPGVQNATAQPDQCPQGEAGQAASNPFKGRSLEKRDVGTSEDCLFLNVHVPSNITEGANLPVVVWVHGGGYVTGSESAYPTENFVRESNYGVIAVALQYRLGVFGFLPGREVKKKGALNAGLLDQQFCLQWVREHISLFGGDPFKVTIWGSSAGAGSVLQHIVAHGGHTEPQLFRGAIMSSPFLPFQYRFDDIIPEKVYSEVTAQVNCTNSVDSLACLRSADVSLLSDANNAVAMAGFVGTFTFVPVVDDSLIVERPTETLKRGRVNGDALLVISNTNEGAAFVDASVLDPVGYTFPQYVGQLFPHLNDQQIQQVVQLYSTAEDSKTLVGQAAEVMGDSIFTCPGYDTLAAFGKKAWKGFFAIPPGSHGEDLSYEFTDFITPPTYINTAFQHAFSQAFFSVAISLDPNAHFDPSNITPEWAHWSRGFTEMLFNKTETDAPVVQPITTSAELLKRCRLWSSLAAVNAQ